jgi:hypothetical protein
MGAGSVVMAVRTCDWACDGTTGAAAHLEGSIHSQIDDVEGQLGISYDKLHTSIRSMTTASRSVLLE